MHGRLIGDYHAQHAFVAYILHDRAGTFASLLYKAEKSSVCLSVRLSDRHAGNSVISAWIDVGLGLCRAVVSGMCTHISLSFLMATRALQTQ